MPLSFSGVAVRLVTIEDGEFSGSAQLDSWTVMVLLLGPNGMSEPVYANGARPVVASATAVRSPAVCVIVFVPDWSQAMCSARPEAVIV